MASLFESWSMIDQYHSIEEPGEIDSIPLLSEEQLRLLLNRAEQGPPRLLILCHPSFHRLFIGIGGPLAGVLYYDNPKFIDGRFAVSRQYTSAQSVVFISEDCPTTFPAVALMPPSAVVDLVCDFINTGQLSDSVDWVLSKEVLSR